MLIYKLSEQIQRPIKILIFSLDLPVYLSDSHSGGKYRCSIAVSNLCIVYISAECYYGLASSVYIILSSDPRYGNLVLFYMGRVRLVLALKMLIFNGALSETRTSLRHLPRKDSKPHFLAQYPPRKTLSPGKPSPCIASFSMLVVEGFVCIYIILSSDPRYGNFI